MLSLLPRRFAEMQAFHRAQLPPTGASHALSVRLTPLQDSATPTGTVVSHLITARASVLQLWEVREFGQQEQVSFSDKRTWKGTNTDSRRIAA